VYIGRVSAYVTSIYVSNYRLYGVNICFKNSKTWFYYIFNGYTASFR